MQLYLQHTKKSNNILVVNVLFFFVSANTCGKLNICNLYFAMLINFAILISICANNPQHNKKLRTAKKHILPSIPLPLVQISALRVFCDKKKLSQNTRKPYFFWGPTRGCPPGILWSVTRIVRDRN